MMRFQRVTISLASLALVLTMAACSAGGPPVNAGNQCPDSYATGYAPGSQDLPPGTTASKVSVATKPDGTTDLPPGNYAYNHAELYYVDNLYAPSQNYRLHMEDVLQKDGVTFGPATICQRNLRVGMGTRNLNINAMGIYSLHVDATSKPTIPDAPGGSGVKTYGFKILPEGQLQMNVTPVTLPQKPADPGSFYPDASNLGTFAYIHPELPNMIEIRSTGIAHDDQGVALGTWYLSVYFWRTDLPNP